MIYNPQFSSGCPLDWVLLAKGAVGVLILAMTQLGITKLWVYRWVSSFS